MRGRSRSFVVATVIAGGLGLTMAPELNQDADVPPTSRDTHTSKPPRFDIDWLRGELQLSGDTVSRNHEQNLIQVAEKSFPNTVISTDFKPMGLVPDYWEDVTLGSVTALAPSLSARAKLRAGRLDIRGIAGDDESFQHQVGTLQKSLPQALTVNLDTIVVDQQLDPGQACNTAFRSFSVGAINFEESNAVLRSSAYPRLERVIAMADACRQAVVSITGHSDASGNEFSNRQLSERRAAAVANYVASSGIDRSRLRIVGVGSTEPVATNKTRFGRSLNRRIEISFERY